MAGLNTAKSATGGGEVAESAFPPPVAGRRTSRNRRRRGETLWGLLFIAPTALGLGLFYAWPTVRTLYFSFTEWGAFGGSTWVGLANYRQLIHDDEVLSALINTFQYTALVLLGIPLSIVIAAMINQPIRGVSVYRTLYFLPVITMPAAIALVWRMLYNGDYGMVNYVLGWFGISGTSWLTNQNTALIALALVGIWSSIGYNVIIFTAGLQGIPTEVYDAAAIDGAGKIRQFTKITMPLLTPSVFFVSVITIINTLQVFDLVFMMMDRLNPAMGSTRTIVYLFYEAGFVDNQRGYAAAIAFVLLGVILALTAIQFRLQRRWVHYE